MKMFGLTAFALILTALVAQGGDDAQKKDKAAIEGKWKVVSFETSKGKNADLEGATMEFDKDGKSFVFSHNGESKKGSFTLNPAGKPKEMDIKAAEDKTFEGIYDLNKDTLKICLAPESGDGRPSEFAVKEGKSFIMIVFDRVK